MAKYRRLGNLFFMVLFLVCGAGVSEAVAKDLRPEAYFKSTVVEAGFDGVAAGRAYATEGARAFAIGGRDADGNLLKEVQILEKQGEAWVVRKAELSSPVAFAGAVGHGGKVYLVGGLAPDGVSARVTALSWDGTTLSETELAPLPEPRMLPAVATHRSTTKTYLYVLGGLSSPEASEGLATMHELRLNDVKGGKAVWVRKDDMPQGGRIGAVVTETYNELVVAGGWILQPDRSLVVSDETWGFARVARDGHVDPGWERRAPMPEPVARPAYAKTGQAHLTILGGAAGPMTLDDLLAGRAPSSLRDGIWAFHDPTDSWAKIGVAPEPVFGGVFLGVTGDEYLLAGARTADGSSFKGWLLDFVRNTKPMKPLDYAVIVGYFLIVAAIGAWFARKQTSAEEYALGNRKVKWWAAAISMFASGVSTISFMALPALVACIGLAGTGPAIFMLVGILVSAFLTYPLLRRLNITSTFEYLEHRYGLPLRLFGSFLGIVGQLMGRIGIVVMLPALAVSTMTGIDPWKAVLLIGVVTTIYSTIGGYESVIWTDVTQGILMFAGFTAIGVLTYMNIDGGVATVISEAKSLNRFHFFITDFDLTTNMMWFAVIGQVIGIMAFASDQATAQRVLSTPMRDVRKLAFLGGAFGVTIAYIVAAVGIGLFAFFRLHPELLNPVMKNDQMVPLFILAKVPVGLSGLMIATLFAAAMSTVSTSVNSCAVMFGEDFYKRFRKGTSSKAEMRVMQAVSLITGFTGTGMAIWLLSMPMPTLWETFLRIQALFGGGFVGVYALGMFTRRANMPGAIVGVAASCFVAFYVQYLPWDIHYGGLGIAIVGSCIIVGYLASLIIPSKRKPLHGLTVWDTMTDDEAEARMKIKESL